MSRDWALALKRFILDPTKSPKHMVASVVFAFLKMSHIHKFEIQDVFTVSNSRLLLVLL